MGRILRNLLALSIGTSLLLPLKAYAQNVNTSSLAVNPSIVQQIVAPGASESFNIQLINVLGEPLPVHLSVVPMNGYFSDPAINWVSFPEPDIILQSKQVQNVKVDVVVPKNGEPGGHYLTIYATPLVPVNSLSSNQAHQLVRVGVLTSIIVKGKIIQNESITGFQANKGFYLSTPVKFNVGLHNSGNIHLLVTGNVSIYNYSNQKIKTIMFPPGIILPKTSKHISVTWNHPWALGPYTAKVGLIYGTNHNFVTYKNIAFWVLPWPLITFYAVLILLAIFMVKRARHKWIRAFRALLGK